LVAPGRDDAVERAVVAGIAPNRHLQDAAADLVGGYVRHGFSPSRWFLPRPPGLDGTPSQPAADGAKRAPATGPAENWGGPSGGTDFPLARTIGRFTLCRLQCPWWRGGTQI